MQPKTARVMAGVPDRNNTLFHRIRFPLGGPCAILEIPEGDTMLSTLLIRDIEVERARKTARADRVHPPADFAPAKGLSGDRETATAQAAAECARRAGVRRVVADRTLPMIFADEFIRAGIAVECDRDWGVLERRRKFAEDLDHIRECQRITMETIRMACEAIARARPDKVGVLQHENATLTAERVMQMIDSFLLARGYQNPGSIVSGPPHGGDCHAHGTGPLHTGAPIIIDIYPRSMKTRYNGDCTRTVVNGTPTDEARRMHRTVLAAKAAATQATRAGVTGDQVYRATIAPIHAANYGVGLPPDGAPPEYCSMQHGTGHGLGLDVHEPPYLAEGGEALIDGDVVTIEPGLYSVKHGGIRVEDIASVRSDGCEVLGTLHEGLEWA